MPSSPNITIQGLETKAKKSGTSKPSNRSSQSIQLPTGQFLAESKRLQSLAMITRQLAIMTRSGTPLVSALNGICRQAPNERWRDALTQVQQQVEEGQPLSQAMQAYPACFDQITCAMVAAGEQSGRLPEMLNRLANIIQKQLTTRNGIAGALLYPILLILVVFVVFAVTLTAVVPRFEAMFQSLQVPLPPTTAMLIALSHGIQSYWWLLVPMVLFLIIGFVFWVIQPSGKRCLDRVLVYAPLIGPISQSIATAQAVRLIAELVESHVPLLEAIDLTKDACSNHLYENLLDDAKTCVIEGHAFSRAFDRPKLINPSVYEAISSGEKSGQMAESMLGLAGFLDEENEQKIKSLTTLLEPLILMFLGLVVGGLAISLFLPLFDLSAMAGESR